ncbi:MAG: flagellar brake protein [Syntrophales bacterium]|jgi:c-di-GMP-binding flagellar brake protein YcgR|nr:flagellar brake protein [Syntrophales bacterium]
MSENIKEKIIDLPGISFGMIIQIQAEGLGMSHSRLIGVDSGAFLIVKTPPIIDIATKLYDKNKIVIRYFSAGWVYAFRCTLLSLIKEPSRLSILSYPENIEKINIRKHDRVDCNIPVEMIIEKKTYNGIVTNISAGGLSLEIAKTGDEEAPQLNIQDVISLTVQREAEQATSLKTIVRNIKIERTVMKIGMEFYAQGASQGEGQGEKKWLEDLVSENL